jgi:hypothetical protein
MISLGPHYSLVALGLCSQFRLNHFSLHWLSLQNNKKDKLRINEQIVYTL